jgi:hypothetical protein
MKLNESILMMVEHIRNAFEDSVERDDFVIVDGEIALSDKCMVGEWIAVTGSILNNGIYKVKSVDDEPRPKHKLGNGTDEESPVTDEAFTGAVWRLRLPSSLVKLCEDVRSWMESPAGKPTNITSESVVGFYSKTVATSENGAPVGWEGTFKSRISDSWREMWASELVSSL